MRLLQKVLLACIIAALPMVTPCPLLAQSTRAGYTFRADQSLSNTQYACATGSSAILWDLTDGQKVREFLGHSESLRVVMFTRGGDALATGAGRSGDLAAMSTDNSARLWDVATGDQIQRLSGHEFIVNVLRLVPEQGWLLSVDDNGNARFWNVETGAVEQSFEGVRYSTVPPTTQRRIISRDKHLFLGHSWQKIVVWNYLEREQVCHIDAPSARAGFVLSEFDSKGERVLTANADHTIQLWNAWSGEHIRTFHGHTNHVMQTFITDENHIVSCSADKTVRVWDTITGEALHVLEHPGPVDSIVLSSDGRRCLAKWRLRKDEHERGIVQVSLWDLRTGEEVTRITDESDAQGVVGFTPDARFFLVGEQRPESLRSADTGEVVREFQHDQDGEPSHG